MMLRIVLIALALPVLAMLAVLGVDVVSKMAGGARGADSGASVDIGMPADQLPGTTVPNLRFEPEWEGLSESDWAAIDRTAARIRSRMLESINDDFRASIDAEIRQRPSPFELNQQQLDEMRRYQQDPAWPTGPAVPGIAGFEIQTCASPRVCLSDLLREQPDDPVWARPMEARLISAIAALPGARVAQVHITCRQSICGILLPSVSADNRLNLLQVGGQLADDLGFATHSLANRENFQVIYLSIDEVPSAMWIQ